MNFASDNTAPLAPEVMAAIAAANHGSAASYGADAQTARLQDLARSVFETDLQVFPVATGTAANGLSLATVAPPYGAIFCHETAHILLEECGAPEFYTGGAKLIGLPGARGKLTPDTLREAIAAASASGVHHVKPAAVSLTQATEWGTVYRPDEIRALGDCARDHGLRVHMDGARLANATARLGCRPAEITWRAGVDVLSLGLTKDGALAAEAVVVFDPVLAEGLGRAAQARRPSTLEDAVPQYPARGDAGGGPLAAPRRPCQRHGRPTRRRPERRSLTSAWSSRSRPTSCSSPCRSR